MKAKWWHGDTSARDAFRDQRWDRDHTVSTGNAEGPGLYFTSDRAQAETYGPYLYAAELGPTFNLLPRTKPRKNFLMRLAEHATEESIQRFMEDWEAPTLWVALERYSHQDTQHDAAVALYGDLFKDAERWVQALVGMGYHGVVVPVGGRRRHLVVWEPKHLHIERVM